MNCTETDCVFSVLTNFRFWFSDDPEEEDEDEDN